MHFHVSLCVVCVLCGEGRVGTTMVGHCGSACILNQMVVWVQLPNLLIKSGMGVSRSGCETSKLILGTNLGWLGRIGVVPLKPFGDD
jgi:hypothetical protein